MTHVTAKLLNETAWITFTRSRFDDGFDKIAFAKDASNYDDRVTYTVGVDGEEAAESAFDISNNPARQAERDSLWGQRRSLSVGDLVEVWEGETGKTYLCDSIGWLEI